MGNSIRLYIKKKSSVAVKRIKGSPPIKTDAKGKEYVELDEEGQAVYQILSDGFSPEARERARGKLVAIWNGKKA